MSLRERLLVVPRGLDTPFRLAITMPPEFEYELSDLFY
jgi:hypothetical protein